MILLPGDTVPYSSYNPNDPYDYSVDLTELNNLKQIDTQDTQQMLIKQLEEKLSLFELSNELFIPLFYTIDNGRSYIKVDFQKKIVSVVEAPTKLNYVINAPAWSVKRVLDGNIRWVQWSASFRAKITRKPDKFNELLLGFIVSEPQDILQLCERTKQLRDGERMIVEHEGATYEVNRYCPHQWADLKGAPIKDGKLICPRHRWEFDLSSNGECVNSSCSIKALEIKK
jgi:UDP-MurNAc hydroxylase